MGCGGVGDIDNVAGSNSVAVPCCGKESRRDAQFCFILFITASLPL